MDLGHLVLKRNANEKYDKRESFLLKEAKVKKFFFLFKVLFLNFLKEPRKCSGIIVYSIQIKN